jgi:hypothetical protein
MNTIWMKICNEKIMLSFLPSHHDVLVKCTTNLCDYNFFHIGFEVISYDYNQLCRCLEHLVVDFLVAKDKIPSSVLINDF